MLELFHEEGWVPKNWCFQIGVLEKTTVSPLDCKEIQPVLGVLWKNWCWGWNSNTLATSWEELTHWKRPWGGEGLGAEGKEDDRGWDGWMASPTQCTWVWVNSGSWWWTGNHTGVLRFMGWQRVWQDWVTELNWTDECFCLTFLFLSDYDLFPSIPLLFSYFFIIYLFHPFVSNFLSLPPWMCIV